MASLVCIVDNPAVWHGRVDALIGSVALTSLSDSDDEDDDDEDDGHFVEVKKKFVEIDIPHPQVISQAIVFSFLQNQRDSQQKKTLIPTIGVSSTQLVVYFYDSETDVLLQSAGVFLTEVVKTR